MKKIVLLFVTVTTMFACAPTEVKTDTAASATGTVTATGPDVDLIKKSITAWADGDWATYASTYADTAKSYHNVWPSNTDTTVGVKMTIMIENFKKQRELMTLYTTSAKQKEIAKTLSVSQKTLENRVKQLSETLNVTSRQEFTLKCISKGLSRMARIFKTKN